MASEGLEGDTDEPGGWGTVRVRARGVGGPFVVVLSHRHRAGARCRLTLEVSNMTEDLEKALLDEEIYLRTKIKKIKGNLTKEDIDKIREIVAWYLEKHIERYHAVEIPP